MNVSIDDAKTMWCPMVRAANGVQDTTVAVNQPQLVTEDSREPNNRCIANRCMMWRPISDLKRSGGFCGLAGRPEFYS